MDAADLSSPLRTRSPTRMRTTKPESFEPATVFHRLAFFAQPTRLEEMFFRKYVRDVAARNAVVGHRRSSNQRAVINPLRTIVAADFELAPCISVSLDYRQL